MFGDIAQPWLHSRLGFRYVAPTESRIPRLSLTYRLDKDAPRSRSGKPREPMCIYQGTGSSRVSTALTLRENSLFSDIQRFFISLYFAR